MSDEKSNGQSETEPKKPTCFVVSPIGAAGSPERKHANVTLRFIIEPVLERCGFQKPLRADTLGEPGIISRQIISQLLNADLVVADLTDRNPNVFYELAIRHGTGKPFVQLITKGQVLPFDVGHQRTIFFDRTDLEDVEECKTELERQVKAVMVEGFKVETPIGQTLDYEKLRSGGGVEQALARLSDQVAGIQREQDQVGTPTIRRISSLNTITPPVMKATQLVCRDLGVKATVKLIADVQRGVNRLTDQPEELSDDELYTLVKVLVPSLVQTKTSEPEAKLP